MADIVSWSPIDDNNNAAPPDGWPEGQMPSTVNNTARGMMGALRRWYDTVTAQIASLTTALGNYLPLTGGTLSGQVSAPQYNINGIVFANSDGTTLHISDATGNAAIQLQAAASYYDADTHVFRSNASANVAIIDNIGNLTLFDRYIHFDGAGGTVNTTGGPLIYVDTANHVYKQGSGSGSFFFQNYAGVNIANIGPTGIITAPAFVGNVTVPASGPISTGGTVTGGQVTSTGNVTAGGTVTGGTVTSTGNMTATGTVTGGTVTSTGNISAAGYVSSLGYQTRAGAAGAATGNYFNIEWRPGAHLWIDNVDLGAFVFDGGAGIHTSSVFTTGGFFTTDVNSGQLFVMYSSGNVSLIQFIPGWYLHFNGAGGQLAWVADSNVFWAMRYSDHTCLNQLGPVAGVGAYINSSDRRGKTDIVPTTKGLAEVLRLSPVEFSRTSAPDRRELGFVAQDVEGVLPEAVCRVGITLPDGTGGLDDAEPSLGITDSTIVAALVNAVKTLNARIATLEEARHE